MLLHPFFDSFSNLGLALQQLTVYDFFETLTRRWTVLHPTPCIKINQQHFFTTLKLKKFRSFSVHSRFNYFEKKTPSPPPNPYTVKTSFWSIICKISTIFFLSTTIDYNIMHYGTNKVLMGTVINRTCCSMNM